MVINNPLNPDISLYLIHLYNLKISWSMKKLFTILVALLLCLGLRSQEDVRFNVELGTDSILLYNPFRVEFCLENAQGQDYQPPAFEFFHIVGGPSISSNMSIINGQVSQKQCFTYLLEPKEAGLYYLEPASIAVDGSILSTEPLEIVVLPNPEGIRRELPTERRPQLFDPWEEFFNRPFSFPFPPADAPSDSSKVRKKKRKITRI